MTKPHEETWTTGEGVLSGALYSGETWIGSFTDPTRARLAVQAPRLVQVLLADDGIGVWCGPNKAHWHTFDCWESRDWLVDGESCIGPCAAIRAVLKDAGADLP